MRLNLQQFGGRGGSSGIGGTSSGTVPKGGGIQISISGKTRTYFKDASGTLRALENPSYTLPSSASAIRSLVGKGGAKILSALEMTKRRKKYNNERASTPDYELGTGSGKRGLGKTVIRPKKGR